MEWQNGNAGVDLTRYKTEMDQLSDRRTELERMQQDIEHRCRQEDASRKALEQLEYFCNQVALGLDNLTFEERQQFLRPVVESITVVDGRVKVETVIRTDQDVRLRSTRSGVVECHIRQHFATFLPVG